jgi:hypothetical protein
MAHACNPRYLGAKKMGVSWFEASPGTMLAEIISANKPVVPATWEVVGRRNIL